MRRADSRWPAVLGASLFLAAGLAAAEAGATPAPGRIELSIEPREATIGDPLNARLAVTLPQGATLRIEDLPAQLGPFVVETQSWSAGEPVAEGGTVWHWNGVLKAFRTGSLELPALQVTLDTVDGGRETLATEPLEVTIASVLAPAESAAEEPPEIADLKPPASLPPDYTALVIASSALALLLAVAALVWWLHRRYAASLAAVPTAVDEFDRIPPHVWVYAELQKLLERRLAEQGHVDLFFAELSRILKRYLGGRYRVELMERTSEEVPRLLRQAGCDERAIAATNVLLGRADRVKFAGDKPDPPTCRRAIEEAYAVVDATKPREEVVAEERGAA